MPALFRLPRRWVLLARSKKGATAVIFSIMMPSLLAMTGAAIDVSLMYAAHNRLQVAADAAALAAAETLSTPGQTVSRAQALAVANAGGATLAAADVVTGRWDSNSSRFTAGGANANAVQVTTRYAAANGNAHRLIFGGILGMNEKDISTTAIAVQGAPQCTSNVILYPDPTIPTRSSISTLGGPCSGTCPNGFQGPNGFLQTPEGNPIVRLDVTEADFQRTPNKTLTVRAGSAVNETYTLPRAGRWFVVVRSYTNPYDINDPATKSKAKTNIVYAQWSGGTATWSNNIRGTQTFTTTGECPANGVPNGNGNGNGNGGRGARLVE